MKVEFNELGNVANRCVVSVFWLLLASCCWGLGGYTIQHYSSGNYYNALHLEDMDFDGTPEIIAGQRDPNDQIEIWKYNPIADSFSVVDTITGFSSDIHDVETGDLDNDGDIDLVVTQRFIGLYVAINNGGSWTVTPKDGIYGWEVHVSDFDKDGNLDIFHGTNTGYIRILYGNGSGGFTLGTSPALEPGISDGVGRHCSVVDIDGNGRDDIIGTPHEIFTGGPDNFLRVFLNTGTPSTIAWSGTIGPLAGIGTLIATNADSAADLDGNGVVDQVVTFGNGDVLVFWGSVAGPSFSWAPTTIGNIGTSSTGSMVANLNNDNGLDVFIGGDFIASASLPIFNGLELFLGDGTGGFVSDSISLGHPIGLGRNGLHANDIDKDGAMDIIAIKDSDGFVVMFAGALPVADPNGPYVKVTTGWGATFDLDGSGSFDPQGDPFGYQWDMDLSDDSDMDGDPTNDIDATDVNPEWFFGLGETEIALVIAEPNGFWSDPNSTTVTVEFTEIDIDVKPGSFPNSINLKSGGVVSVAFLTDDDFDASTIDPATITLKDESFDLGLVKTNGGKLMASLEDVDGDGDTDLVVKLDIKKLAEFAGDLNDVLELGAKTEDGVVVVGTDSINIVQQPNP